MECCFYCQLLHGKFKKKAKYEISKGISKHSYKRVELDEIVIKGYAVYKFGYTMYQKGSHNI